MKKMVFKIFQIAADIILNTHSEKTDVDSA